MSSWLKNCSAHEEYMDEEYTDFTGLSIFDVYGVKRVPLEGEFNAAILAERLVEEWIPYYECHKCGRFDYCKFVERKPHNPTRAFDIKCGVLNRRFASLSRRHSIYFPG